MDFITQEQFTQLAENGKSGIQDPFPVVVLHIPNNGSIWLLTSIFEENPDVAYGLVIEDDKPPNYQCVWLYDLFMNNEPGESVIQETAFVPQFPISVYKESFEQGNFAPLKTLIIPTQNI